MGNENSGRKKTQMCDLGVAIAKAHPDWGVWRVYDELRETYPTYTEAALRGALKRCGIVCPPSKRPIGHPLRTLQKPRVKKAKAAPQQEAPRHQPTVHGYAGRSRWSARYTEL